MARSRKKAATAEVPSIEAPTESSTTETGRPDIFDEQSEARKREAAQQAAGVVQDLAEHTRLPADVERQAAHETGHTPHHGEGHAARHHQHREHGHAAHHTSGHEQGQSHTEAVGKRPDKLPGYTDVITDTLAGARFLEHRNPFLSIIRFEEKPSDAVRTKLREEGFDWNQRNEEWKRPINYETRQQDRITAERVFEDVTKMIRTERGITHSFGGAA